MDKIESQIKNFTSLTKNQFHDLLYKLQEYYTNEEPIISDDEFDYLKERYEEIFNEKWEYVGSIPRGSSVKLPVYASSLNKIKGKNAEHDIKLFYDRNNMNDDTHVII